LGLTDQAGTWVAIAMSILFATISILKLRERSRIPLVAEQVSLALPSTEVQITEYRRTAKWIAIAVAFCTPTFAYSLHRIESGQVSRLPIPLALIYNWL